MRKTRINFLFNLFNEYLMPLLKDKKKTKKKVKNEIV